MPKKMLPKWHSVPLPAQVLAALGGRARSGHAPVPEQVRPSPFWRQIPVLCRRVRRVWDGSLPAGVLRMLHNLRPWPTNSQSTSHRFKYSMGGFLVEGEVVRNPIIPSGPCAVRSVLLGERLVLYMHYMQRCKYIGDPHTCPRDETAIQAMVCAAQESASCIPASARGGLLAVRPGRL